jgi:hypothetical protein
MELGNMRGVCMRYNDIKHDRMIFDDRAPAFQISHGEVNANGAGDMPCFWFLLGCKLVGICNRRKA